MAAELAVVGLIAFAAWLVYLGVQSTRRPPRWFLEEVHRRQRQEEIAAWIDEHPWLAGLFGWDDAGSSRRGRRGR